MTENRMDNEMRKRAVLLPVRAVSVGFPITVAVVLYLWSTGYPAEEWAYVSGVLAVSLFVSGILVGFSALFVAKCLDRYGKRVLLERGIDVDAASTEGSVSVRTQILVGFFVLLILSGAIWGVALNVLLLVVSRMGMPSLGAGLESAALVMLCIALCGLLVIFGGPAVVFYLSSQRSLGLVSALVRVRASAARSLERGMSFFGVAVPRRMMLAD